MNDLANDYGNLISRTTAMIDKFYGGIIPGVGERIEIDYEIKEYAEQVVLKYYQTMNKLEYTNALEAVLELIRKANQYIEITSPWDLAKSESNRSRLRTVLYQLVEFIRISKLLFEPFLPSVRIRVWQQLGLDSIETSKMDQVEWGYQYQCIKINRGKPLFPRIDLKEVSSKTM
jgi:methionyl-tRNA synthetase